MTEVLDLIDRLLCYCYKSRTNHQDVGGFNCAVRTRKIAIKIIRLGTHALPKGSEAHPAQ